MSLPAEPTPDQSAAARLTAWALDELPAQDQSSFEGGLDEYPELRAEAEATRAFCQRLESGLRSDERHALRLSPASRQTLEDSARSAQKSPVHRLSFWMPTLAAAACIAVMSGVLIHSHRKKAIRLNEGLAVAARRETAPTLNGGQAAVAREDVRMILRRGLGYYDLGQFNKAEQEFNQALAIDPNNLTARNALERSQREVSNYLRAARDHTRLKMLNDVDSLWETAVPESRTGSILDLYADNNVRTRPHYYSDPSVKDLKVESLAEADGLDSELQPSTAAPYGGGPAYRGLPENKFLSPAERPLSTFSIDVDTASYAIARRHLNDGALPPPAAVRLEELINYFPMDDAPPPPADGRPFAVHVETASAPWAAGHRLVRVALKGKAVTTAERPAANLVFLVDTSGSMDQPNKLPLVQRSLLLLLSQLEPRDRVALVTYAGESRLALPSTPVSERAVISSAIDSLSSGGSTNGSGGITAAYETARSHFLKGGVNRVILATDGDFNVGLTTGEELETLITREAKSGVYLSVLTYGSDNLKDTTAELLADKGNGNYAYIDSLSEARRALVAQLGGTLITIARDVKIQVEFNPAQVASYRLLGYENRALADRDFRDDTKDAGEIGAGHSVTALYEIVPVPAAGGPNPASPGPREPDLKYQTPAPDPTPDPRRLTPQAASGEMLTVKLRWQQPEGAAPAQEMEVPVRDSGTGWAQAGDNFRWTAAVAGYGLLLKGSAYAGTLTWDTVRAMAAGAKGPDPDGFRGEFLQLIEKAAGLSAPATAPASTPTGPQER